MKNVLVGFESALRVGGIHEYRLIKNTVGGPIFSLNFREIELYLKLYGHM